MAESVAYTYATTTTNAAATSGTPVAVINDTVGNRQVVVLGKGDGTTGLVDGTTTNPLNTALPAATVTTLTPPAAITNYAFETGGNLAAIKADTDKIPSKGTAVTANSTPVNIASDQVVPVSASALPLPSGAATSANQTSGNTSLTTIATNTTGLATATNQSTANTSLSTIATNTTGVATAANQSTEITNLSAINTNTGAGATSANQTNGNQLAKITNGINTADVVAGDSGFNGVAIANGSRTLPFTTSIAGAQTLLANTYIEGFSFVQVIFTQVGSGLGVSNNVWSPVNAGTYFGTNSWASSSQSTNALSNLGFTQNVMYESQINGNYFQLSITSLTSGTVSGYVILSALPRPYHTFGVSAGQNGTWNVGFNAYSGTGTITSSSSTVTYTSLNGVSGFIPITIHGTYAGITFGITESDDAAVTFYNVPIYDSQKNVWLAPGTSITPANNSSSLYWVPAILSSTGTQVKVTATAYTSGTANIRIEGGSATDLPGSMMSQIMDAAGNNRGANVDANGNMNTSSIDNAPAPITATWVAATSINTALTNTFLQQGFGTAVVTLNETGTTTTAGAVTFEVFDGTTWSPVGGQQINTYNPQVSTYTLVNGAYTTWQFDIAGFQGFRTRLSTAITGTGTPQLIVIQQIQATANEVGQVVGVAQQLDSTNDATSSWEKAFTYTSISASTAVVSGACVFGGFLCSASSSGVWSIYDNTAGSGQPLGFISAATVANTPQILAKPINATTGVYALLVSGTGTIQVLTRNISK